MIRMGVVADDVTGSNDIGIMFAKAGYRTRVYNFENRGDFTSQYRESDILEVIILNTNSRLDDPATAYRKVYDATIELQSAGCRQFHNKTCSVFRGNIGIEFDAMLDAAGKSSAVVVLGFPKNGRTTINGIHHVRGIMLEESEFRNDPVHPMRQSNLIEILKGQTQRNVDLITHEVVANGVVAIKRELASRRSGNGYTIVDVTDQNALAQIAGAVADEAIICGSSAIAEELPAVWQDDLPLNQQSPLERHDNLGIICAAGSLMPQTYAQIDYMRQTGVPVVTLDTVALFGDTSNGLLERCVTEIVNVISSGRDVIFHTSNQEEQIKETYRRAVTQGYDRHRASRLVSDALASVVSRVLEETGQNRILIAGGETSDAVCKRLNINSLEIYREIQAGLPSCFSLNDPRRLLILKSGSFGSPDFFEQAVHHLRTN